MTEPKAPKAPKATDRNKADAALADAQHAAALALDAQMAEKVARQNARFKELGEK